MRSITPAELTFHSFRHSQGAIYPQLRIFRYMDLVHGVQPDLHPVGTDRERFLKYLGGSAATGRHIDTVSPFRSATEDKAVYATIKDLRKYQNSKYGQRIARLNLESNISAFAGDILGQEMRILDQQKPWASYRSGEPYDRPRRLAARITDGKSSFMLLHGRDGQPTGSPEFDGLYAAAWRAIEDSNG